MQFTHALNLMSGESITITENQAVAIRQALINGSEWVPVGNELINAKSISKVGYHHATADMKKRIENTNEIKMIADGKGALVNERRKLAQKLAIDSAIKENRMELARMEGKMTEENEEKGEPMYYLNEHGEKIYS